MNSGNYKWANFACIISLSDWINALAILRGIQSGWPEILLLLLFLGHRQRELLRTTLQEELIELDDIEDVNECHGIAYRDELDEDDDVERDPAMRIVEERDLEDVHMSDDKLTECDFYN